MPSEPKLPTEPISMPSELVKNTKRKKIVLSLAFGLIVLGLGIVVYVVNHQISRKSASNASVTSNASSTAKIKDKVTQQSETAATISVPDAASATDPTKIALGDGNLSTAPKVGSVYSCQTSFNAAAGGAFAEGPWLNKTTKTWDSAVKTAVAGAITWPTATYAVTIAGSNRLVKGNGLPINSQPTGKFPVGSTDPAYNYDRNPNSIAAQTISLNLPVTPVAADSPHCVNGGAVGILQDGVILFNALDGLGRDAAAHEVLDTCEGHPERTSEYHHHNIPSCIVSKYTAPSTSTLVGYANDGYGIYLERDASGKMLTNANLDGCHGRTSNVLWDGNVVSMYHYNATIEYPYTVGCFHGTSTVASH